jgi:hypothetical protein
MRTEKRPVTFGETDGIQKRLKPRHEGPTTQHDALEKGYLHQVTSTQRGRHLQGLSKGSEDERANQNELTVMTQPVQRTLRRIKNTTSIMQTICKCGKVCKNPRGQKIHQAKSEYGNDRKQEERTSPADQTEGATIRTPTTVQRTSNQLFQERTT